MLFLDTFKRAKEKLKKAETVTDVNTDNDELLSKKRRRITAAKWLSSSDSEEEDLFIEHLPPFPNLSIVQKSYKNKSSANKSEENKSSKKILLIYINVALQCYKFIYSR